MESTAVSPSTIRAAWGLRHPASGLMHGVGALGSLAAAAWAVLTLEHPIAVLVFALSMFLLYGASTAYHLVQARDSVMRKLRLLDHSMIYIFIAGSYTPFCLNIDPARGVPFLIATWSVAALGVALKLFNPSQSRGFRVAAYLGMAWVGIFLLPSLASSLSTETFRWFIGGALAYTFGAGIYAAKRPDPWPAHFGFHEIWHLFVLAGSFCHFMAVLHIS